MNTTQANSKRRFFMVLPLLVIPFITMMFWALGGGTGIPASAQASIGNGLNVQLPEAQFDKREIWDKLNLYEKAESDSAKFRQARDNDPYFDLVAFETTHAADTDQKSNDNNLIQKFPQKQRIIDANEEKVNRKLSELYREINKAPETITPDEKSDVAVSTQQRDPQFSEDVDRLENLMLMMKDGGESSPEMQQIESVLDKLLDVQHPERVKERMKKVDPVRSTAAVRPATESKLFNTLSEDQPLPVVSVTNGFYGLDDEVSESTSASSAIEAVIHDTQELAAGATVKMRLTQDIEINGILIPKDEMIYGTCSINGERLAINIHSVRHENSILPVTLKVYDLDGLEGIYIPGAITRDAAKKASDDAMQSMQFMSMDPTLEAQAAGAGLEAVKGLFSKKAKLIKVTVKAGYRILLVDAH